MVAVKSLWVLLKSFSTNFSFKRDSGVRVPDHKPDKRIRYNRLRPQWHRPYYPSSGDPEMGGRGAASSSSSSYMNSSKSYQDCLNGNCTEKGGGGDGGDYCNKDFDHFCDNSDSDYEDGDSDGEDFDDDFTTTDEDEDSDLDDDDVDEVYVCEVCERSFPSIRKLADHQEKKKHFGCPHCDSIFSSEKALNFHREQMDHFDFVSDYGTDDATSFGSGSVGDRNGNSSSLSSGIASCSQGSSNCSPACSPTEENKCCVGSNSGSKGNAATGSEARCCSGKRNNNSNNYHCYSNQLHASWYEGDDEEEKGLLRTN